MNDGMYKRLQRSEYITSVSYTHLDVYKRQVHHLEIPWRPADMEQRNGRAVRKGNTVKLWGGNVVNIVIYEMCIRDRVNGVV